MCSSTLPIPEVCNNCDGTGQVDDDGAPQVCYKCGGKGGLVFCTPCEGMGRTTKATPLDTLCPFCRGLGCVPVVLDPGKTTACYKCRGEGILKGSTDEEEPDERCYVCNGCGQTIPCPACGHEGGKVGQTACTWCGGRGVIPWASSKGVASILEFIKCPACDGTGADECCQCQGKGEVPIMKTTECPECGGTGIIGGGDVHCSVCSGTGEVAVVSQQAEDPKDEITGLALVEENVILVMQEAAYQQKDKVAGCASDVKHNEEHLERARVTFEHEARKLEAVARFLTEHSGSTCDWFIELGLKPDPDDEARADRVERNVL